MNGLRAALGLLTRLPVPAGEWRAEGAARWLPAAAAVLAAAAGIAAWATAEVLPASAAAAVAIVIWVALSGALHLDGLADSADAALAAVDRERRLAILRDVHHGTFGVTAVVLVLLVKFGALVALTPGAAGAGVFAAALSGRCWLPLVARLAPPLRPDGMGAAFRRGCTPSAGGLGVAVAFGGSWLALGGWGVVAAAAAGAGAVATALMLRRAFGGLNGDAYGTCIELAECAALLTVAGLGERAAPWELLR